MLILKCPSCNTRVAPKVDGHCPSCGASITDPRTESSAPASVDGETSATSPGSTPQPQNSSQDAVAETPLDEEVQPINTGLDPIEVMPSKIMSAVMLSVGVLFGFAGVIAIMQYEDISMRWVVLGGIGLLFSPIMSIYSLIKLSSNEPVLVINDEGIIDNASPASVGLIKWSEILELLTYRDEGICFLGIAVKNPNEVLSRRRGMGGMLARFEAGGDGPTQLKIPQTFLSMPIPELLEQIASRYQVPIRQSV
jgi:hypothetical protein